MVQRILQAWIAPRRRRFMTQGGEACVEFISDLAGRVEQHEDRLRRLEEQAWRDSRTSSTLPSMDLPKTRAQRRAEARARAKELMRREGAQRQAGGRSGHRGAGRDLPAPGCRSGYRESVSPGRVRGQDRSWLGPVDAGWSSDWW